MHRFTVSRLILGFFLLVSIIFAVTAYRLVATHLPEFVPLFIFWLLSFIKMLYDASSRVHLTLNRFVAWLVNTPTNWEFAVQYTISAGQESAIEKATASVFEVFPKARLWQDGATQKVVHVSGFTARIKLLRDVPFEESEPSTTHLFLDLTDMNVSYRYIEKTLFKVIVPLLEKLSRNISAEWTKYTLRIKYNGANPFFGLYVKTLPARQVAKFNCELFEIVGNETGNVRVEKEKTVINTTTIASLLALSKKYLSLSPSSAD